MQENTPLELKLYDEENEVIRTLTRAIVPWGLMKKAMALGELLEHEDDYENMLDELTKFICLVFADKVTTQELDNCADAGDMLSIFQQIMTKARGMGKPTAGTKARKK